MKLKPPSRFTVASDLIKVFKSSLKLSMSSKADIGRLVNLRCSQLPFCPTSLLFDYLRSGLIRDMDMLGAYFTSVGTTVHEVMQRYLAMSGRFLADYVCPICGKVYPLSTVPLCCGGHPTEYHEIQIDVAGIQGHIDAVFRDSSGRYWILDFKTSTLLGAAKKQVNPGIGYIEQVESYAYLLWRQYGIKVEGTILMFLPRDNPTNPSLWVATVDSHRFATIKARIAGYRKLHKQALEAVTRKEVWALTRHKCKSEYCRYCKLPEDELKQMLIKAFKMGNELPMSNLRVPEKPEASVVIYHRSPFHAKRQVKIKSIDRLDDTRVRQLGRRIHKELLHLQGLENQYQEDLTTGDRNAKKRQG